MQCLKKDLFITSLQVLRNIRSLQKTLNIFYEPKKLTIRIPVSVQKPDRNHNRWRYAH